MTDYNLLWVKVVCSWCWIGFTQSALWLRLDLKWFIYSPWCISDFNYKTNIKKYKDGFIYFFGKLKQLQHLKIIFVSKNNSATFWSWFANDFLYLHVPLLIPLNVFSDVWSRWRRGGDRCGQCSLHGRVLLSGQIIMWKHVSPSIQPYIEIKIKFLFFIFVSVRSKTLETVLIKLTRMWPKSRSFTQSSCLLPHQIRVSKFIRHFNFYVFLFLDIY